MAMDGVFRPQQIFGYLDPIGQLDAANRLRESQQADFVAPHRQITASDPDAHHEQSDHAQQEAEQDLEETLKTLFEEQFQIQFHPDRTYEFCYNEVSNQFDLIDLSTHEVLLTLAPETFLQITKTTSQGAGVITDRSA